MTVRSKKFFRGSVTTVTFPGTELFVVPSGFTWLVRTVTLTPGATPGNICVVGVNAATTATVLAIATQNASGTALELVNLQCALEPGDSVWLWSSSAGENATADISGAALDGVAP